MFTKDKTKLQRSLSNICLFFPTRIAINEDDDKNPQFFNKELKENNLESRKIIFEYKISLNN
jgi:hypothetical protein